MNYLNNPDALLSETLAMNALIAEFHHKDMVHSPVLNMILDDRNTNNKLHRTILMDATIGNPVTMQMLMYALLVIPWNTYVNHAKSSLKKLNKKIKAFNPIVQTTFPEEEESGEINYIEHIKNSVSAATVEFMNESGVPYVMFMDNQDIKTCVIKMKADDMSLLMNSFQRIIMLYLMRNKNPEIYSEDPQI